MKSKMWLMIFAMFILPGTLAYSQDVKPFLGRWALELPMGAGWIEVKQEDGYLDGSYLWIGGSVLPADFVYLDGNKLIMVRSREVTRKKDDTGKALKTQVISTSMEFTINGDKLEGRAVTPVASGMGTDAIKITGKRIPDPGLAPDLSTIKFGQPVTLFNGKDLSGWSLKEKNARNGWKVTDGELVNDPVQPENGPHVYYGNLRTDKMFNDFNLQLEVKVPQGSNSGVYLKGIYEVQVMDSYNRLTDSHNMGAIYSRITPVVGAEKPAGEWQSLDITLCKRHVTVILNGTKIIDNQPVFGVTGGAMTADEFIPGPIYLQGDHGNVSYRNMVLKPILE